MKKLALILTLALTLLPFSACAPKPTPTEPITITVWHYYNGAIKAEFDELVSQFNQTIGKEKNIIVDAYTQGGVNELADAVLASANGDVGSAAMPNIFASYSDNAYRLDKMGVVAPLDVYFTEQELQKYRSEFLQDGRFSSDGKLKIMPIAKSTELVYINMTAFEEFSKETGVTLDSFITWEGIANAAEQYYNYSGGKAYFGIDVVSNFMIQATKQLGNDIFSVENDKTTFNFDKQTAKKIWQVYYEPFIKGYYAANGRFRSDDVKSDVILAFTGSNSSAAYFPTRIETGKDEGYSISSNVLPYPTFEGTKPYSVQQGAGMVVVKSDPETEKACMEFLKWFASPEQNIKFATSTSYLPVQNESLTLQNTLKALGTDKQDDIHVQTAQAFYSVIDSTTLYAAVPFDNSVEARDILNTSLPQFINEDMQKIQQRVDGGENRKQVIQEYLTDENFERWYTSLISAIDKLL